MRKKITTVPVTASQYENNTGATVKVVIEVPAGQSLKLFWPNRHYRIAEPVSEVFWGATLADSTQVTWCETEQKWAWAE